jgi:hypothetical protein
MRGNEGVWRLDISNDVLGGVPVVGSECSPDRQGFAAFGGSG